MIRDKENTERGTIASLDWTHTSIDLTTLPQVQYTDRWNRHHTVTATATHFCRYIPTIIDRKPLQNPTARGVQQIKTNKPRRPTLIPSDAAVESRPLGEREDGE